MLLLLSGKGSVSSSTAAANMVFLARLLCQRPKGADFGLYAGVNIMSGVKVTFSNKKLETNY